jgi:signal transduction histidine kinase/CheY-like chemotaxis protein
MTAAPDPESERVLVLAPIGRDAPAAALLLRQAGIGAIICSDAEDLLRTLERGAGAALVAEEGFGREIGDRLVHWVEHQPPWSDFPFVVLTSKRTADSIDRKRLRLLSLLKNVSLLERPVHAVTLVSAVQAALRARRRQYEVRGHLLDRERATERLESLVAERTRQLEATNERLLAEIAERKRTEAALRHAQKMEAIGQLTGGIAHDFNNLLTAITGNLDLLQRRLEAGSTDVKRFAGGAMAGATRAAGLTQRLLAFARRQPLSPTVVDVNQLVSGLEDIIGRTVGEHIRVRTCLSNALWRTWCDTSQLETALINLVVNARDAMPDGGSITIETGNAELGRVYATDHDGVAPDQYVCVAVSDTGGGMPPEVIARAFDPFFTTKPIGQGTGLGLSMIYGFVRQSGGHVALYSDPGQGTTVRIYLPRHHDTAPAEAVGAPEPLARSRKETVLVVEDEAIVRMVTVEMLGEAGYRVLEANDAPGALRILDSEADVDLLVTDVGLPGLNGRQLAEMARQSRPELKVLFVTGYGYNAGLGSHALEPGMEMLSKPFTTEALVSRVAEMLDRT